MSTRLFFALLAAALCTGCSSGTDDGLGQEVKESIPADGGSITHPAGLELEFPQGAFDSDTEVTITTVNLPADLPSGITAASTGFSISSGGADPAGAVVLRFTLSLDAQKANDGALGIFRWDGTSWSYAGGNREGDILSAFTGGFSTFAIGVGRGAYKLFAFHNDGSYNVQAFVNRYTLRHPELDSPISNNYLVPVFKTPFNPIEGQLAWLPQGCYEFCAEWEPAEGVVKSKLFGTPPPQFQYCLTEHTSLVGPPSVLVSTNPPEIRDLPCGPPQLLNPSGDGIEIAGDWTGVTPPFDGTSVHIDDSEWSWDVGGQGETITMVEYDNDTRTCILKYLDQEFEKITWTLEGDTLGITFYESETTLEAARNDTTPDDSSPFFFTRDQG